MSDIKVRHSLSASVGQVWVSDLRSEPRAMYTDDEGVDYDILDMRNALIAIKANTAPKAISLSPRNRSFLSMWSASHLKAIYEICCRALP